MRRTSRAACAAVLASALTAVLVLLGPGAASAAEPPVAVPADGSTYFGVTLGNGDTPATYAQRSACARRSSVTSPTCR